MVRRQRRSVVVSAYLAASRLWSAVLMGLSFPASWALLSVWLKVDFEAGGGGVDDDPAGHDVHAGGVRGFA